MSASNSAMFQRQLLIILTALRPRRRREKCLPESGKNAKLWLPEQELLYPEWLRIG
jgi:hypothetical protein